MPLLDLGSETVLNGIRNNGTKVRIIGLDSSIASPPSVQVNYESTIENITWLSPTDASGTWTVTTNPTNPVTWLIEPADNETITINAIQILDSDEEILIQKAVSEPFERDGEFTLDQLIVAVE